MIRALLRGWPLVLASTSRGHALGPEGVSLLPWLSPRTVQFTHSLWGTHFGSVCGSTLTVHPPACLPPTRFL